MTWVPFVFRSDHEKVVQALERTREALEAARETAGEYRRVASSMDGQIATLQAQKRDLLEEITHFRKIEFDRVGVEDRPPR